jgi:hypothetical protein
MSADDQDVLVPRTSILVTPLSVTGIMTTTPARSACNGKGTAIYGSESRGVGHTVIWNNTAAGSSLIAFAYLRVEAYSLIPRRKL